MEKGEMYASMGPVFNEITFDGENLHIECSPARHIFAYTGSKPPRHLHTLPGEEVTSADFVIDPRAPTSAWPWWTPRAAWPAPGAISGMN